MTGKKSRGYVDEKNTYLLMHFLLLVFISKGQIEKQCHTDSNETKNWFAIDKFYLPARHLNLSDFASSFEYNVLRI